LRSKKKNRVEKAVKKQLRRGYRKKKRIKILKEGGEKGNWSSLQRQTEKSRKKKTEEEKS